MKEGSGLKASQNAYSMIELLVVVMIIGMLSTFALYVNETYIQRSYRMEAQSALHRLAVSINLYKLKNFGQGYKNVDQSPEFMQIKKYLDGSSFYLYTLEVSNTGGAFLLSAAPKEKTSQAGDGLITLNQLGFGCWFEGVDDVQDKQKCPQGQYW